MARGNESTTRFRVDISELKAGMQEAKRQIRMANAEFKAATAGMDKWGDSADGISAKIKQLTAILDAEKTKLENLKKQYELVAQEQGENSRGAQELLIQINNQMAAIKRTEAGIEKYNQKLEEVKGSTQELESAYGKLRQEIEKQEKDVEGLKREYSSAVLQFGKNSDEAKKLAKQIEDLSGELSENRQKIAEVDREADELDKSLNNVEDSARKTESGFTIMKGAIANLISDGLKALAKEVKDTLQEMTGEMESAHNSFQAKTGASKEEMKQFGAVIDEVYKSGMGESLEDVSDVMAEIKQQMKETDPNKLKELSVNAITLRDTFDMDVKESMRAVNMLMQQFGVSGEEAFNLIVQGAQNGLDKNGDLLDTINEYSVHYKQMGYNASEFLNSIGNGTENGIFSVDILTDSVKEFGIRSKDTSKTTQEAFELLGYGASASKEEIGKTKDEIAKLEKNLKYAQLEQKNFNSKTNELTRMKNADKIKEYSKKLEEAKGKLKGMSGESKKGSESIEELQKKFAAGGDTAREATQEVLDKLFNMEDAVKQNQIGVGLFGTKWEDLGKEGVKALMDVNGKIKKNSKAMEEIKKIKYDDVNSQYKQLGRTLQMELLAPLAGKALPYIKDFCEYAIEHVDGIAKGIKAVGGAIAVAFAINKIATFIQSISTIIATMRTLKATTAGAAIAQKALNLAQMASPVALLVAGLAALTVAVIHFKKNAEQTATATDKMIDKHNQTREAVEKLEKSYKDVEKTRNESVSDTQSQFAYYEKLKSELDNLVDKNGKVKKSEQSRAKFIMNTLNEALGTELKLTKKGTTNYLDQKKALEKLIETQKAKIIMDANTQAYTEAINNQKEAFDNLEKSQEDLQETTQKLGQAEKKLAELKDPTTLRKWLEETNYASDTYTKYQNALTDAEEEVMTLDAELKKNKKTVEKTEEQWTKYNSTIQNYEGLSSAIISGDAKKIQSALNNMVNHFITAKTGTKKQLEKQVQAMKTNYENMKKAVEKGAPGVSEEMVESAKKMVENAEKELDKLEKGAKGSGEKAGRAHAEGFKANKGAVKKAAGQVAKEGAKGLKGVDTKKIGQKKSKEYKEGIESGKSAAGKSAEEIGKIIKSRLKKVKSVEEGENFVQGFINGIKSNKKNSVLLSAVTKIGKEALATLRKTLDEHSPSKETEKSGAYFTGGFAIGIISKIKQALEAANELGEKSLITLKKAVKTGEFEKAGEKVTKDFEAGIKKRISSVEKAMQSVIDEANKKAKSKIKSEKVRKQYAELGKAMMDSFSSSFEKQADKAISKVEKKMSQLTSTYQSKYDDIKSLQEDLESRLSAGELFTENEDGTIVLTNFAKETQDIQKFGANLEKLKAKISPELLKQIAGMETDSGLKLSNRLLALSDTELNAYSTAYTQKLKASQEVAKKFYAKQLETLKNQYTKKVESEIKKLNKSLSKLGENAAEGFLKGFASKDKEMSKEVKKFANSLVKKIKKELGINSPSTVMREMVGKYIPFGVAEGIRKYANAANVAMSDLKRGIAAPISGIELGIKSVWPSGSRTAGNTKNVHYTINQTNNSPKALSRWDIYRQTQGIMRGALNV